MTIIRLSLVASQRWIASTLIRALRQAQGPNYNDSPISRLVDSSNLFIPGVAKTIANTKYTPDVIDTIIGGYFFAFPMAVCRIGVFAF